MRVFIAINLLEDLKAKISSLINSLPKQCRNLSWQNQDQWHITLRFLGEVNPDELARVFNIAQNAVSQFAPFILFIQNFMAFPSLTEPRIIGLKIKNNQKLDKLIELMNSEFNFVSLGQPEKKKFKPHLTLARIKKRVGDITDLAKISLDKNFAVSTVEIMESVLEPSGAQYRILKSFPLKNES